MSEQQEAPETDAPEQPQEGDQGEPEAFDADYVAKLRKEAAKYRTEAKANAEAAKRLAEIEEASKSEQERQAERLAQLEREAEEARAEALRFKVAAQFGIRSEHLKFLTGSDEDELAERAKELVELYGEQGKPRPPKPDPNQGRTTQGGSASTAEQFAAALSSQLH